MSILTFLVGIVLGIVVRKYAPKKISHDHVWGKWTDPVEKTVRDSFHSKMYIVTTRQCQDTECNETQVKSTFVGETG